MSSWINAYACKRYNLNCPYRPASQKPSGRPAPIPHPGMPPQIPSDSSSWQDAISLGTVLQVSIVVLLTVIVLCLVINWINNNGMPFKYQQQREEADVSLAEKEDPQFRLVKFVCIIVD
uniref:Uncharacterized protein n=1 Tax=Ditylenchus dipsaci TaxID=166011 RepID=A0A915CXY5_9BILA